MSSLKFPYRPERAGYIFVRQRPAKRETPLRKFHPHAMPPGKAERRVFIPPALRNTIK